MFLGTTTFFLNEGYTYYLHKQLKCPQRPVKPMSYCNIHFCSCEALGLNPIFSNQISLNKNKDGKDLSYIQICDTNI